MKNIKYILFGLMISSMFVLQSCEDLEVVEEPNFNVSVMNSTIKAGDTVNFKIDDASQFMTFYSGELGGEFKYRERTTVPGSATLTFKTKQKYGLRENATETVSFWYSKDYDGSGDSLAIRKANWVDITDRFTMATAYDLAAYTDAGTVNIDDLDNGAPIYFAFKYKSKNIVDRQPQFFMAGFKILLEPDETDLGIQTVADMSTAGFKASNLEGIYTPEHWNYFQWAYQGEAKNSWRMLGHKGAMTANEDWLITSPILLTTVKPDLGTSIKTFSETKEEYFHIYKKPGTYVVTFQGNNTTINGSSEKVQQLTITVESYIAAIADNATTTQGTANASLLNVLDNDTYKGTAATLTDLSLALSDSSTLPTGLKFNKATGAVEVEASLATGVYTFVYVATSKIDSNDTQEGTVTITIE